MRRAFAFILGLVTAVPGSAIAACTIPDGTAGDQIYNNTYNVMQFCNGSAWVNMGVGAESDPEVGTLMSNKWCAASAGGTAIDCTQDAPSVSIGDGDK